jgi:hypothetical protein
MNREIHVRAWESLGGQFPRATRQTCERCAGQVKIIACIEDPAVIERILAHLKGKAPSVGTALLPENRGPPQARLGVPASSTDSMTP